jgi:cytochrome c5
MRVRILIPVALIALAMFVALAAAAGTGSGSENGKDKDKDVPAAAAANTHTAQDSDLRLEGQRKFHSNCGRCHAAPPKFSPRMAATIVRHMRVRATITDEEGRLILRYLAQ